MPALFPFQDSFVRGELSPRLHARASLDLYRAGLSKCENWLTLPHGGLRKRPGTYFAGAAKNSSKAARLIPFIFSSEQSYCLEVGDQYLRVYAYGARVGTVEVATPWAEADIWDLQFTQSADVMWIVNRDHAPYTLTRNSHTSWSLAEFIFNDGPYLPINTTGTTLTPAAYGSPVPTMSDNTTPSGTVASSTASSDAWKLLDRNRATSVLLAGQANWISYEFAGGATKVVDAYYVSADTTLPYATPSNWELQGWDGSAWVTLDTRTSETGWGGGETRFYEFTNDAAFSSYRWQWFAIDTSTPTVDSVVCELGLHEKADYQTAFNLTASSTAGINGGSGFQASDVGRSIRLLGSDNIWRWGRITGRSSTTVVQIKLYNHAFRSLNPIPNWRLSAFEPDSNVESVAIFEERLAYSKRFSVYASKTGDFENFSTGEADDDALEFINAGGGEANDIVWLADADGFLLIATTGGIRALSGSGLDEALTPSSFKNRKSRTLGCARMRPVDAGASFFYVPRSRKAIVELTQNAQGRFASEDVGQISEHLPKRGVVEIAFQQDPDPMLWFPVETGELIGLTYQPSQEVRGMHRHVLGGSGIVESVAVTPGLSGSDDVWLLVRRTIDGQTKRYIEVLQPPFEYMDVEDAFFLDCGLSYSGTSTTTITGLSHLNGATVSVFCNGKTFTDLSVSGGSITLPEATMKAHVGLPFSAEAETLELDAGGRDGSLVGRRKKVSKLILSLLETDTSCLEIQSVQRGRWEKVRIPTVAVSDGLVSLETRNVEVPIDDSWEGQGKVRIRHTGPTPCTIRGVTTVFDGEP